MAILLVFAYHAVRGLPYATAGETVVHRLVNAGWIGVDLFFVLSGFLITGILLDTRDHPAYFRTFYGRRILRIVPLYLTFVAIVLIVVPAIGLATPAEIAQLSATRWWYWTHTVNLLIARDGWAAAAWHTAHLWSLSVEEQFYLVWPLVVFASPPRRLAGVALGVMAAAALLRTGAVMAGVPSSAMYVLLPTRMDSLATGALLAAATRVPDMGERFDRWFSATALVALGAIAVIVSRQRSFRNEAALTLVAGYPALAIVAGAAILGAVSAAPGSLRARLWTNPVLRFFGRYSYGLYVWHYVVIPLLRNHLLPDSRLLTIAGSRVPGYVAFAAVALVVSVAVALLSWYLIEQPMLRLKRYVSYEPGRAGARRIDWPVLVGVWRSRT